MTSDLCEQTSLVSVSSGAAEKVDRFPDGLSLQQRVDQHKPSWSGTRGQIPHQQSGVRTQRAPSVVTHDQVRPPGHACGKWGHQGVPLS